MKWADLSPLGAGRQPFFSLSSSDVGLFGMNTPAYFCMDHISLSFPVGVAGTRVPDLFEVYPNPTADVIQITHSESGPVDCYLFDANGKLALRQPLPAPGGQIDLQHLLPGTYFATLKGKQGQSTRVVVRE
ncbi:MAG: T9SS type A sorting domain-containing protein [Haliscomenobacter sp.]|nr:T9SS type A sorting domain-containing protein [Haliscomenobacter sp.]